ncbi:helix-turn-helix domain-containing protein [Burkholderia ambifaria]|uniref:helix-turn-helix domain-containing protein n=1 Tax=Burkholderia ambifaria TaxID=152480 RepID=UPI002FDFFA63
MTKYDPSFKQQVVKAHLNGEGTAQTSRCRVLQHMWCHELSYQRTCAVFDLREANCISRWERQYHDGGFEALMPRRKGRPPKMKPFLYGTDRRCKPGSRTRIAATSSPTTSRGS